MKAGDYRPALKVVSFDIETAMEGCSSIPSPCTAMRRGEERRVFMLGEGATQDFVSTCATQEEVLQAFLDWVAEYDPDVLIGWNVVNFDTWYLQRLADQLGRRCCWGGSAARALARAGRGRRAAHGAASRARGAGRHRVAAGGVLPL